MVWRISGRASFVALRRGAQRGRCGPISVAFTRADGISVPRVGYAVGRRAGKAVERNRIRRRLRAAVAELEAGLGPGSYLVSASREAGGLSYEELKQKLTRAMTLASQGANRGSGRERNL